MTVHTVLSECLKRMLLCSDSTALLTYLKGFSSNKLGSHIIARDDGTCHYAGPGVWLKWRYLLTLMNQ